MLPGDVLEEGFPGGLEEGEELEAARGEDGVVPDEFADPEVTQGAGGSAIEGEEEGPAAVGLEADGATGEVGGVEGGGGGAWGESGHVSMVPGGGGETVSGVTCWGGGPVV